MVNKNAEPMKLKTPKGKKSTYDKKQNRMIQKIWSLTRPEIKTYRSALDPLASEINVGGIIFDFPSKITLGTASSQRIGDQIKIQSIQLRYVLKAGDPNNLVRLTMLRQTGTTLVSADYPGVNDYIQLDKIFVYKDKLIALETSYNGSLTAPKRIGTMNLYFKNGITIDYAKSIHTDLQLHIVSDSSAAPHPVIDFVYLITYTDV